MKEKEPDLIAIHRSFAETEHGQTLASQVRYDKYKPGEVSNERWIGLLGADVCNLSHLPLTYGLTKSMVKGLRESHPGFLNEEEENLLKTAALIHDWAESIVGDISFGDKTTEDEIEEEKQLNLILSQHSDGHGDEVRGLVQESAKSIVFNTDSKLGNVFNTVERVGYLRTALRASQHVREDTAQECDHAFRWLAADVLNNQLATLIDRSSIYVPVGGYLNAQSSRISESFGIVHPEVFENYPPEKREEKLQDFNATRDAWFA